MRGQQRSIAIPFIQSDTPGSLRGRFIEAFSRQFGVRVQDEQKLEIVKVRLLEHQKRPAQYEKSHHRPVRVIQGPMVDSRYDSTVKLNPGWSAQIYENGDWLVSRLHVDILQQQTDLSLHLEIYRQRLMCIAEEMGIVLGATAISANIRERHDFSCAIFDHEGRMLAHAAHIPVHLGATPLSVLSILQECTLAPDCDYFVNDPYKGGTHLLT